MTQTVPLVAALGASKTGLTIGYRVLNLDRTEATAFTTTGVSEGNVAGTYYVSGGISAPDAGGYVVVGVSGTDYAEAGIEPAAGAGSAPTAEQNATAVRAELATELGRIDATITSRASQTSLNTVKSVTDKLDTALELDGAVNRFTANALEQAPTAAVDTTDVANAVNTVLTAAHGSGLWTDSSTYGTGAYTFPYTLTSSVDGSPIPGADVWITTDEAGETVVASGVTDAFGVVTFFLDAGTYFVWRQCAGWNFTNPDTEIVGD